MEVKTSCISKGQQHSATTEASRIFQSVSLLLGSIGFEREEIRRCHFLLAAALSCSPTLMTAARLQNCIFLTSMSSQLQTLTLLTLRHMTAKCHEISFITPGLHWHKWWHQVHNNNNKMYFLLLPKKCIASSRNIIGTEFEDTLGNHWETKSSISSGMWVDNCLSVSHPFKWHCFYNILVPDSLKNWLVT